MSTQLKYSVLLVDDDISTIKLMANLLTNEFNVSFATSALTSIRLAQKKPQPDVILLDVLMPDIDGYEVCRRLKKESSTQGIPVIFFSSLNEPKQQELGFNYGAVDYIEKQIEFPLLRARLITQAKLRQHICHLENLAAIDPLTSCANRRKFEEVLSAEWKLAGRNTTPVSMLMVDVDNFKSYNDNYGHVKGDECLVLVAKILNKVLSRPTDLVARYGGEEFAIILPNTNNSGAIHLAKKVLTALANANILHEFSDIAHFVTVSIGVTTMSDIDVNAPTNSLALQADSALYEAKNSGKFKLVNFTNAFTKSFHSPH